MSLTIEAGKFYKLANGDKAKICERFIRSKNGDIVFVGYRINAGGNPWAIVWNENGTSQEPGLRTRCTDHTIIAPWTDPPVVDWSSLPAHIVAVARDGRGRKMGFTAIPELREEYGGWRYTEPVGYHQYIRLACDEKLTFTGDWRDSLAVRPGWEEEK